MSTVAVLRHVDQETLHVLARVLAIINKIFKSARVSPVVHLAARALTTRVQEQQRRLKQLPQRVRQQ